MAAFLVLFFILLLAAEAVTRRAPLRGVEHSMRALRRSVGEGEAFEIESRIVNGSRMPKVFIGVTESFPSEMEILSVPSGCTVSAGSGRMNFPTKVSGTLFLLPRRSVTRRYLVRIPARGRYFLYGAELTGGDLLGLYEQTEHRSVFREIVVLPSPSARRVDPDAAGGTAGDRSVRRFILEDPVLTVGFREYTGREPQKQIAWLQSLREGRLMVREYDHTTEKSVTVLLNVEGAGSPDDIEEAFRLTRSACEALERKRIQYGFVTNAMAASAFGFWKSMSGGLGAGHLMAILEGLGRATHDCSEPFARMMRRAAAMAEPGRNHVLITASAPAAVLRESRRLEALTGGRVTVLAAGDAAKRSA